LEAPFCPTHLSASAIRVLFFFNKEVVGIDTLETDGALSTGKTWTCWSGARGGYKNDLRAGTLLL